MERLTYHSQRLNNPVSFGACENIECGADCENCKVEKIIEKLCAYEDTGLEPKEITVLIENDHVKYHLLYEYQQLGTIDYLRELVQADLEMPVAEDKATKGGTHETNPV